MAPDRNSELVAALCDVVGRDAVITDPDRWSAYTVDWTGRWSGSPPAIVLPSTTDEVVAVIAVCQRFGAPWVPQGGNTGLVGGGVPVDGEVVVSTNRLQEIGPVDENTLQVSVGAGVTLTELTDAVSPFGLMYGIDFGARDRATIGGTIATNAGGNAVLHYGMTSAQVVGIEAVLPDGSVISRMGGLVKDNTGLDLAQLLCGSEGTLGIITAARLKLRPKRQPVVTAALGVASFAAALRVLRSLRAVSSLVACEAMRGDDIEALRLQRGWVIPLPWTCPWAMLIEATGGNAFDELASAIAEIDDELVREPAVVVGASPPVDWWRIRDAQGEIAAGFGPVVKLDVSVPLDKAALFVDGLDAVIANVGADARSVVFGHLGDGNLHVNVAVAEHWFESVEVAVLQRVLSCGGVISAEHGIGRLKREWLVRDRGAADVVAMRAIKRALDPHHLANPNVMLSAG